MVVVAAILCAVLPMFVISVLVLPVPVLVLVAVGVLLRSLRSRGFGSVDGPAVLPLRVHVGHLALGLRPEELLHLHLAVLAAGHLRACQLQD